MRGDDDLRRHLVGQQVESARVDHQRGHIIGEVIIVIRVIVRGQRIMRQKLGDGLTLEIIILGLSRRNAGAHDPGLHAPLAEYGLRDRVEHHITAHLRTHVADHADVRLGRGLARQHRGAGVPFGAGDQTGHAT